MVTSTAASGRSPELRHLMLKNFSAPMSAPKPASVMRKSVVWMPMRSPTTEELPWAMFPNGPAWTMAGVFSSVWSRLGLIASRMMTVIAPPAPSASAVIGSPWRVYATTMRSSRCRRSWRDVARASTAITSDAAVMSKPV